MKKITLFIVTIFTVATLFAAARPSLDGRAVVAESGIMPKGLFARTVGYLPGDSVTVTNPATGSTIDVLILGAIDPSEGVAILLSPEAAEGLRIKPDSNVQVKLTKRAGSLDENANGSAVLSEGDAATETASSGDKKDTEVEETPAVAETKPAESEKPSVAEETPAVATLPVTEEKPANDAVTEAPKEEIVEETPVVAENKETPAVAEKTEPYVETPVVAEKVTEDKPQPKVVGTVYEELPPLPEENLEKVVVIESDKSAAEEAIAETPVEEPVIAPVENTCEDELVRAEPEISEEESVPVTDAEKLQPVIVVETEKVNPEDEDLQPIIEELPILADNGEPLYEELPAEIEAEPSVVAEEIPPENTDAYQPIVLVPADMNPPAPEENVEKAEEVKSAIEITRAEETAPVTVPENTTPVVSNDWTNYVVPSFRNLRSGCYYVQVASLGNTENIKNIVDKYSSKYPLVLVQNGAKTAYQVMVGPLNIDEYGSVDEKFKSYGFKDSFVRKIR